MPGSRNGTSRQRVEDTPSHPGGLSDSARQRLIEHRKQKERQREGIDAGHEARGDVPKGLGDFQRRLNRDNRGQIWDERDHQGRNWDSTPRSIRGGRDAPSVRVPNVAWDSTPRSSKDGEEPDLVSSSNRRWDAPTPRAARGGSPDGEEGTVGFDMRDWEDEQVRLDRDWYTGAEDGGVAGGLEHNPLSQYEDLGVLRDVEIATKQVVRSLFLFNLS